MSGARTHIVGDSGWQDLVNVARAACEPLLRQSIDSLPDPLRHMAGYHFGWWDCDGRVTHTPVGKALRPALVMAAARACGCDEAAAAPAAAAIELAHNFSLIHDDVMDADITRRGRATVWSIWGTSDAILVGDALQTLACGILTELPPAQALPAISRLTVAIAEMCCGQVQDCAFESRSSVETTEYLAMATAKTGALIGCAAALGALCAGADPRIVAVLDTFGRELGIAFQCADDIIGMWGEPSVTGKPVGNDLARRKWSLPVVLTLAAGGDAARRMRILYRPSTRRRSAHIHRVTAAMAAAGIPQQTQRYADERLAAALACLPPELTVPELTGLAGLFTRRCK